MQATSIPADRVASDGAGRTRRGDNSSGLPDFAAGDPFGYVSLRRGVWLYPDRLGWNADVHMIGPHVLGGDRIGTDHRIPAYPHSGKYGCVIRDPNVVLQHGARTGDVSLVYD